MQLPKSDTLRTLKKLRRFLKDAGNVVLFEHKRVEDIILTPRFFEICFTDGDTTSFYNTNLDTLLVHLTFIKGVQCDLFDVFGGKK